MVRATQRYSTSVFPPMGAYKCRDIHVYGGEQFILTFIPSLLGFPHIFTFMFFFYQWNRCNWRIKNLTWEWHEEQIENSRAWSSPVENAFHAGGVNPFEWWYALLQSSTPSVPGGPNRPPSLDLLPRVEDELAGLLSDGHYDAAVSEEQSWTKKNAMNMLGHEPIASPL